METPRWFKIKGYYHFSSQIFNKKGNENHLINKITNPLFIAKYSFYPLLHTNIKSRRYKKLPINKEENKTKVKKRAHSYYDEDKRKMEQTVKVRPLHYANHTDSLIYSYYAHLLNVKYEEFLKNSPKLNQSITAYRKIPIPDEFNMDGSNKNKGSIHFAGEVFTEVKQRMLSENDCVVLAMDIKSFFSSLDHQYLKQKWIDILNVDKLPDHHDNVFKSITQFSFIFKNDLRRFATRKGRKANFDEKKIAQNRNLKGIHSFFATPKEFRDEIKSGRLRVYKNNFRNKSNETIGIPQGLPISAVLANIYLMDFDQSVIQHLVERKKCFYRRYSDDIIIICRNEDQHEIENFLIDEMQKTKVSFSSDKTEKFLFKHYQNKLMCFKYNEKGELFMNQPLTYLGFEFYGYQTLIKSENLSKFYRRMIYSVKKKARIAKKIANEEGTKPVIFKRQLYPLYRNIDLNSQNKRSTYKVIKKIMTGEYRTLIKEKDKSIHGNYFSYVKRSAGILNAPEILNQIRKERKIFNEALIKNMKK